MTKVKSKISKIKHKIIHKIVDVIEKIIEHHFFKPATIAIITSFILFNGFSFLSNHLDNKEIIQNEDSNKIKINIPDEFYSSVKDGQILRHKIQSGDTILNVLFSLGAEESDVFSILTSLRKVFNPREIRVGDEVIIEYQASLKYQKNDKKLIRRDNKKPAIDSVKNNINIKKLTIEISPEEQIIVEKNVGDSDLYVYKARKNKKKLNKHLFKYVATISNSLYVDGTEVGVSPNIMINMINLYSFDVDFQRDIREGDKFEILYESYFDDSGKHIKDGEVLFARLDLKRVGVLNMYRHKYGNIYEYFNEKGNSVRKSLLRTPVNGARISSGFGLRRHPVLGYNKLHKGVDFAAPRGTPIFAAGDGNIDYLGRKGSYGNYVRIHHNSKYSTAYAHMNGFAKGLRKGSRVKQGQVIGYVGTTGRSTGPHLHYEVLSGGKQINPSQVKTTSGINLKGQQYKNFIKDKKIIDDYLANIPNQNKL